MAIFKFTESDRLAGKILEKGGYKAQITEIESKASTSQKSINSWITIQLLEGPWAGKELNPVFNTETDSPSLLGNKQFFPNRYFLNVLAAINNVPYDKVELGDFDTDSVKNKPFDILVDVETSNGELVNVIRGFFPVGSTQGKTPF